ncbi:MAG: hypothetical protein SNH27_07495 [Rikenellaceae bacterium]
MKNFKGKAIYNPSGKAGEYSYWACNFYVGCSNDCAYCYCKKGVLASHMGGDTPTLKKCFKDEDHAMEIFQKELLQNLEELQKHGLFFSFTTDPLLVETAQLTVRATEFAARNNVPVSILTKGGIQETVYFTLQERVKDLAFGFTLTGHDELEPFAPSNKARIRAMEHVRFLFKCKVFASIEPVIDVDSSLDMINASQGYCDLYKVGLLSGGKYEREDIWYLINELSKYAMAGQKIYIKDSVLKAVNMKRSELPDYFVDRDFNIFKGSRL